MKAVPPNSTVVLVHAAWADGSCWSNVILPLDCGLPTIHELGCVPDHKSGDPTEKGESNEIRKEIPYNGTDRRNRWRNG